MGDLIKEYGGADLLDLDAVKSFAEFCYSKGRADVERELQGLKDLGKLYSEIRADAEIDFQNSDYWNDYLAKVIADAKAEAIDDVERELLASGFIFTEHALEVWNGIAKQLKEQKQ